MSNVRQVLQTGRFADLLNTISPMMNEKTKISTMLVILLAVWPMFVVDAGKAPSPIFVNKCCRLGEKLERNKECSFGGTQHWWPVIFMIMKYTYFEPHGDAPRFFKVNEFSRPRCHSPELISGAHTMALFSNGTLYLPDRTEFIDSDNFCVDKDTALVCSAQNENLIDQPPIRTLLRKCCPAKAIYQTETDTVCVNLHNGHELIERKLVENSTNPLEIRYGFPQCNKSTTNNIAIVGKFNESKFDENTGNLTLTEGIFRSDQYCLEYFNDTNTVSVHVFTCTEYLPNSGKSIKVKITI